MNSELSPLLSELVLLLPESREAHRPDAPLYSFLSKVAEMAVKDSALMNPTPTPFSFEPFGEITFPHHSMGAITTSHLFGLDELIIYSFYWRNRKLYKKTADLGANLGLHSILMAKLGFNVTCFEPDPSHFSILSENLARNNVTARVQANQAAVSDQDGTMEFVRVLGNTTSSHLAGAKANPYGELERFPVKVRALSDIMRSSDLIKMDIEGHEAHVLEATSGGDWAACDIMMEINSPQNADRIWAHLQKIKVNAFSQKRGWSKVSTRADLPESYKEGSVFLSRREQMPW